MIKVLTARKKPARFEERVELRYGHLKAAAEIIGWSEKTLFMSIALEDLHYTLEYLDQDLDMHKWIQDCLRGQLRQDQKERIVSLAWQKYSDALSSRTPIHERDYVLLPEFIFDRCLGILGKEDPPKRRFLGVGRATRKTR